MSTTACAILRRQGRPHVVRDTANNKVGYFYVSTRQRSAEAR